MPIFSASENSLSNGKSLVHGMKEARERLAGTRGSEMNKNERKLSRNERGAARRESGSEKEKQKEREKLSYLSCDRIFVLCLLKIARCRGTVTAEHRQSF